MQFAPFNRRPMLLLAAVFSVCLMVACGPAEEKKAEEATTPAATEATAPAAETAPAPAVADSVHGDEDSTREVKNPPPR